MIQLPLIVELTINESQQVFELSVEENTQPLNMEVSTRVVSSTAEYYNGSYEFTPTDSEQLIEIKDLLALDNITINPIPAGYGKIGWDGQVLTVS